MNKPLLCCNILVQLCSHGNLLLCLMLFYLIGMTLFSMIENRLCFSPPINNHYTKSIVTPCSVKNKNKSISIYCFYDNNRFFRDKIPDPFTHSGMITLQIAHPFKLHKRYIFCENILIICRYILSICL